MMKKLTRSPDDKWIAGVCGGVSDYTGIDANLIRLVLAICTILGAGSLIIGYVVALFLMPKPPPDDTAWAQATDVPATAHEPAPPSA
jgi:phage shock protein PspC (stress-responsive transcriptional regulator)